MFQEVFGHKDVKDRLTKILPGLSGTYLFHGPPSVGKRTVAYEAARIALCFHAGEDGCHCPSCMRLGMGHPDFLCIGQNERVKVEDVDQLLKFSSVSPFLSKRRVAIIDNADTATWEASNRMLKTLEEPPENFSFILVTSRLDAILDTLRGRSLQVRFGNLSQEDIVNVVWKRLGFELPKAKIIAWIASSSADVFANAGVYAKHRDNAIEFISTLTRPDPISPLDFVDKIDRKEIPIFVDTLMVVLTDLLFIRNGAGEVANADVREDLEKMAKSFSNKALLAITAAASQIKRYAYLNVNLVMALKSSAIRMHRFAGGSG